MSVAFSFLSTSSPPGSPLASFGKRPSNTAASSAPSASDVVRARIPMSITHLQIPNSLVREQAAMQEALAKERQRIERSMPRSVAELVDLHKQRRRESESHTTAAAQAADSTHAASSQHAIATPVPSSLMESSMYLQSIAESPLPPASSSSSPTKHSNHPSIQLPPTPIAEPMEDYHGIPMTPLMSPTSAASRRARKKKRASVLAAANADDEYEEGYGLDPNKLLQLLPASLRVQLKGHDSQEENEEEEKKNEKLSPKSAAQAAKHSKRVSIATDEATPLPSALQALHDNARSADTKNRRNASVLTHAHSFGFADPLGFAGRKNEQLGFSPPQSPTAAAASAQDKEKQVKLAQSFGGGVKGTMFYEREKFMAAREKVLSNSASPIGGARTIWNTNSSAAATGVAAVSATAASVTANEAQTVQTEESMSERERASIMLLLRQESELARSPLDEPLPEPAVKPPHHRTRSKRLSLAEAIDPLHGPLTSLAQSPGVPLGVRPSLATVTKSLKDESLRAVIDAQREEEESRKRHMNKEIVDSSAVARRASLLRVGSLDGPAAVSTPNPLVAGSPNPATNNHNNGPFNTEELEQQVLDEWTSSDEEDVALPEGFKESMNLSRTTRQKFGLRSMREVMRMLSKPLGKREFPLDEYKQSGAFQSVDYWPDQGRFSKLVLQDRAPSHENPFLADPRATAAEQAERTERDRVRDRDSHRASIAHQRQQALAKALLMPHAKGANHKTIEGLVMADGFMKPTSASLLSAAETTKNKQRGGKKTSPQKSTAAENASQSGTVETPETRSRGPSDAAGSGSNTPTNKGGASLNTTPTKAAVPRSPRGGTTPRSTQAIEDLLSEEKEGDFLAKDLEEAFALLDPARMNQTEAEALAAYMKKSSREKKKQAVQLYASAQAAPFVQLRKDMLTRGEGDAFDQFMESDKPLLSDAQIDSLLAAKIDESIRKGFPRNRAELKGLLSRGTVSFGIPPPKPGSAEEMISSNVFQGKAHSLQSMFYEDRSMKEAHRKRNMVGINPRPFSAKTPFERKRQLIVDQAAKNTKAAVNDNPPVGAYNPGIADSNIQPAIHGVDMSGHAGRERMLSGAGGLGAAQAVAPTHLAGLKRPSTSYGAYQSGPSPADYIVVRLFDDASAIRGGIDSARPGVSFAQADIGMRTAIMSETGVASHKLSGATNAFSAVKVHASDIRDPEPFIPLRMPKVFSSIGPTSTSTAPSVTFSRSVNYDRLTNDAVNAPHHITARDYSAQERDLQHANSNTVGPLAPKQILIAKNTPGILFAREERQGVKLTEQERKEQSDRNIVAKQARKDKRKAAMNERNKVKAEKAQRLKKRLSKETTARLDAELKETVEGKMKRRTAEDLRRAIQEEKEHIAAEKAAKERQAKEEADRKEAEEKQAAALALQLKQQQEEELRAKYTKKKPVPPTVPATEIISSRRTSTTSDSLSEGAREKIAAAEAEAQAHSESQQPVEDENTEGEDGQSQAGDGKERGADILVLDDNEEVSETGSTSDGEDSDISDSLEGQFSREVRKRLGPLSNYTKDKRDLRLSMQSLKRKQRTEAARETRAAIARIKNERAKIAQAKIEAKMGKDKMSVEMALRLQDVQMIWLFLIATTSRLRNYQEKLKMSHALFAVSLGHLKKRVAERVLEAKTKWLNLVWQARLNRSARVIQRFMRMVRYKVKRKKQKKAVPLLIDFFQVLTRKSRVKHIILNFKLRVVRLQRWWRRSMLVVRARRELLEKLWARTLMQRFEELLKYRLYLTSLIAEAAEYGAYLSVTTNNTVSVAYDEKQRMSNLLLSWKTNEDDLNRNAIIQHHPFPFSPNAVSSSGDGGGSVYSSAFNFQQMNNAENVWERFVLAVWVRYPSINAGPNSSSGASSATGKKSSHARRQSRMVGPNAHRQASISLSANSIQAISMASLSRDAGNMSDTTSVVSFKDDVAPAAVALTIPTPSMSPAMSPSTTLHTRRGSSLTPLAAQGLLSALGSSGPPSATSASTSATASPRKHGGGMSSHSYYPYPAGTFERALAEFENYLGVNRNGALRENLIGNSPHAGAAIPILSSPSASASGSSSSHASAAFDPLAAVFTPLNLPSANKQDNDGAAAAAAAAAQVSATSTAAANARDAVGIMTSAITRKAILKVYYHRLRNVHRKLIYQARTFAKAPNKSNSHHYAAHSKHDDSAHGTSHHLSITGEVESRHYTLDRGLAVHHSSRWLHMLSMDGMQELLMESMLPRSLVMHATSGYLLKTRHELIKHLRTNRASNDKALQLRHHNGWPFFPLKYGIPQQFPPAGIHIAHRAWEMSGLPLPVTSAAASFVTGGESISRARSSKRPGSAASTNPTPAPPSISRPNSSMVFQRRQQSVTFDRDSVAEPVVELQVNVEAESSSPPASSPRTLSRLPSSPSNRPTIIKRQMTVHGRDVSHSSNEGDKPSKANK